MQLMFNSVWSVIICFILSSIYVFLYQIGLWSFIVFGVFVYLFIYWKVKVWHNLDMKQQGWKAVNQTWQPF